MYLRVYQHSKNKTNLDIASEYIDHALELLPDADQQEHPSYMAGHIGVWFLKAVIDQINGDHVSMEHHLSLIQQTFQSVDTAIANHQSTASNGLEVNGDCTLDTGLSGMVFGALLVNAHFDRHVIGPDVIGNVVYHILDLGLLQTDYLQYESFDDCFLYGPGHGSSGIIKSVFTAYDLYPKQLDQLFNVSSPYHAALRNTMDFYSSIQLSDGNMPTNVEGGCGKIYGADSDARVQWCHGMLSPKYFCDFVAIIGLFA